MIASAYKWFLIPSKMKVDVGICTKFKWIRKTNYSKYCELPGLLQESLGPFGPEVSGECPQECPRKRGVFEGVSDGVSPGPFRPRAPECPKSVPRVSPECRARETPVAGRRVCKVGDATKHFSVKKKGFSVKRGEATQ